MKVNFNKPLTNFDIDKFVIKMKINNFKGCHMLDDLPKKLSKYESIIINLDKTENDGTHWCALYNSGKYYTYFDSFGISPPDILRDIYKKKMLYSTTQIQDNTSILCGFYCLYFLHEINNNNTFYDLIYLYDLNNTKQNESTLKKFFSNF